MVGHHAALNHHVVRAVDGVHLIPKISSGLTETYVDIRDCSLTDWNDHKTLAAAIMRAEKPDLLRNSMSTSLQSSIDGMMDVLSES